MRPSEASEASEAGGAESHCSAIVKTPLCESSARKVVSISVFVCLWHAQVFSSWLLINLIRMGFQCWSCTS